VRARAGWQEWSGHPCTWHVTEPVEVGDYQVAPPRSPPAVLGARSRQLPVPATAVPRRAAAGYNFRFLLTHWPARVQNEFLGDVIGIY
jgi:hypothetical protein